MRLWLGDDMLGALARAAGGDLPTLFGLLHLLTLIALFAASLSLSNALGCGQWTTAAFLLLLTLRHRIAETGANSLEGYMHPRMLAFALGVASFAQIGRRRWSMAIVWSAIAIAVHTTTGLWFGVVTIVALLVAARARLSAVIGIVALAAAGLWAITVGPLAGRLVTMDREWLQVFGTRDYLFPAEWPVYAWFLNLGYVGVLLALYKRRRDLRVAAPGEGALLAGLTALVGCFLVSVPLTEMRVALAVQLQVNRIFWLLDVLVALYLAWWVTADPRWSVGRRRSLAAVAIIGSLALGRGTYVLAVDLRRPLVTWRLPASTWTETLEWLRNQPANLYVLADPQHAARFGTGVRVGAAKDTLLEAGKDPILGLYDRRLAMSVAERMIALEHFGDFHADDIRALRRRFGVDVFIAHRDTTFDFPILHRNADFVVYDLR
jgi:hypothetical protein